MNLSLHKAALRGTIAVMPSKSFAHRAVLCAALARKPSYLSPLPRSRDVLATLSCAEALGARLTWMNADTCLVEPIAGHLQTAPTLFCDESGTTLRFILPLAAALQSHARITAAGRLARRPIKELMDCLREQGIVFSAPVLPFTVSGQIREGYFKIPGHISSQYISALLLILPLLGPDAAIELLSPLRSGSYVAITRAVMQAFGVSVIEKSDIFRLAAPAAYCPPEKYEIEADWSNAGVWIVAGATGSDIVLQGLNPHSLQGDRVLLDLVERMGARVERKGNEIRVAGSPLRAVSYNAEDTPDIVPVLSVACACAEGESCLSGVERLRDKECDRLEACLFVLKAMGIDCRYSQGTLYIKGGRLRGCRLPSFNDHRMVMMEAVAALAAEGETVIDPEPLSKSYIHFLDDLKSLGGI